MQASAHERIKPFGQVAVAGEDNTALAIKRLPSRSPARPAPAAGPLRSDRREGRRSSPPARRAMARAIAGAPKIGDKAAWAPRIAQGQATLEQHAIAGYRDRKGMMPPKGGRTDLPDDAVRTAAEYMAAQSR